VSLSYCQLQFFCFSCSVKCVPTHWT